MLFSVLKWTPRILVIMLIALFLLMSFDVFVEGYAWYDVIIGFIMHNVPTLLIAAVLFVAWNKPRLGGMLFLLLFVATVFFFNIKEHPEAFFASSLPLFIIAMLFILNPTNDSAKLKQKK